MVAPHVSAGRVEQVRKSAKGTALTEDVFRIVRYVVSLQQFEEFFLECHLAMVFALIRDVGKDIMLVRFTHAENGVAPLPLEIGDKLFHPS